MFGNLLNLLKSLFFYWNNITLWHDKSDFVMELTYFFVHCWIPTMLGFISDSEKIWFVCYMIFMVYNGIVTLQAIIQSILESGRLGPNIKFTGCYGLRLKHLKSDAVHWLHPNLTVHEVEKKYEQQHVEAEWRYELQSPSIMFSKVLL